MLTTKEVIELLKLDPHPTEGGYFRETYRSSETIKNDRHNLHSLSTAIYYLLTNETNSFSEMHLLDIDELFHFYLGDPIEMLHLYPDGKGEIVIMGSDIKKGMTLQMLVPGGVWQGARLKKGGQFALLGTTMAPGFEYSDYQSGSKKILMEKYPQYRSMIDELTRKP